MLKYVRSWRRHRLLAKLQTITGMTVQKGPFRGMRYASKPNWGHLSPRLLGTYEIELHEVVESIIALRFGMIIDVGAADGYYAVGLAMRSPKSRVIAFELDPKSRSQLAAQADLNGVRDRLNIHGCCTPSGLAAACDTSERLCVIVDAEGAELSLLDPSAVPALEKAHILVELHDALSPGISDAVLPRFQATHRIKVFSMRPRSVNDLPPLDLPTRWLLSESQDWRPEKMTWALMEPHA